MATRFLPNRTIQAPVSTRGAAHVESPSREFSVQGQLIEAGEDELALGCHGDPLTAEVPKSVVYQGVPENCRPYGQPNYERPLSTGRDAEFLPERESQQETSSRSDQIEWNHVEPDIRKVRAVFSAEGHIGGKNEHGTKADEVSLRGSFADR